MNTQHRPEAHESFDPLDYEELHRNLYTISTLIRGMGWGLSVGCSDDPDAMALFKLAQMVEEEAKQAERFFNEARNYCKGEQPNCLTASRRSESDRLPF